ncbi:MAG: hypothetical protein IKN55_08140 [Oscillospiraceae bacterium]|nr:hypothetical protein [Oscillospiraceae bacterium]
MNNTKIKKAICGVLASAICSVIFTPLIPATSFKAAADSSADIPSEYVSACDWVWDNRIYDDEHEDWMKDYATIYDQLIAGNGTVQYLIRWDSYQTITYEQRQKLETVLNEALNKWNDCLEGYANWPFDDVTVKIVGWSVLDRNCLQNIHADEVVYTETMNSTMRDDIISSGMAADAARIPTIEPSEPTDISRYAHWYDENWNYNGSYDNRYDMFLEGIDGMIDQGGFGWHYGQYLSADAILGLINGTTSQHILLHEMGHGFGFPDYYGGIGESDGIPPGDFPGGEGSVMEAGRAFQITTFDTWFARYAWSKLSAQEGRFNLNAVTDPEPAEPPTEPDTQPYEEPISGYYMGDINQNGQIDVGDAVLLQKWLLAVPDTYLPNWKAGDLCKDDRLDVFDLCLLKRLLVSGETPEWVSDNDEPQVQGEFITANMAKHGASLPTQGDAKLVVFYVDFPDCRYDYEPTLDELNQISFGAANEASNCYPFESFPAFYGRASKGSMNFTGQVFRYTTKENQSAYDTDKVKIAEECYEAFKDQVDFSQFDGNGDGRIDATLFTAPTKAGDDNWWPCAGAFGDPDYRVDGVGIGHIITGNAQIEGTDNYVNYISSYCHELGHCTGLPDYYLFTNPSDSEGMHGTAGIELMDTDAGSDFGAFSKLMEGWYTQEQVQVWYPEEGTKTFTLNNAQTNAGNCLIIPNGQLADDCFSEYFIVEYATKDGNNSGIGRNWQTAGEGVRIYHIDATTEYGWNTYFRYASGSEFTNQDQGRRLIRIIDDTDTDNFYHTGDTVTGSISGFHWYDANGGQTVDTGFSIEIGESANGAYTVTVRK